MTHTNTTKCDGPGCGKKVDTSEWGSPTYHKIMLGGSDFEMSFSGQRDFDFCSIDCMINFLGELRDWNPEKDGPCPTCGRGMLGTYPTKLLGRKKV